MGTDTALLIGVAFGMYGAFFGSERLALWGNYLLNIYWKLNRAEYDSLEKELGY